MNTKVPESGRYTLHTTCYEWHGGVSAERKATVFVLDENRRQSKNCSGNEALLRFQNNSAVDCRVWWKRKYSPRRILH
jgi:hypothetical protein